MSRDPRYQKLLNSKRWWEVKRIVWQRAGGLCEECYEQGIRERGTPYITAGVDCHHIQPIEKSMSVAEMERLCYDPNNVRLLCVPCHIKVHQDMRSHTTEELKANRQRRQSRWVEQMQAKFLAPRDEASDHEGDEVTADGSTSTPGV